MSHVPFPGHDSSEGHTTFLPAVRDLRFALLGRFDQIRFPGQFLFLRSSHKEGDQPFKHSLLFVHSRLSPANERPFVRRRRRFLDIAGFVLCKNKSTRSTPGTTIKCGEQLLDDEWPNCLQTKYTTVATALLSFIVFQHPVLRTQVTFHNSTVPGNRNTLDLCCGAQSSLTKWRFCINDNLYIFLSFLFSPSLAPYNYSLFRE